MAPKRRGRVKKVPAGGGSRRDAALEAMRILGFEDDLIETTLNELLKEYTEEAWIFIEEYSYKVLIDAILVKQEEAGKIVDPTNAEAGGSIGCIADTEAVGTSRMALPSSEFNDASENDSNTIAVEPLTIVPDSKGNDAKSLSDGVELKCEKSPDSPGKHVCYLKPHQCGESSASKDMDLGGDAQNGTIHPTSSRQPPRPHRRRREYKPCYGWIDDDEDDEEDYKHEPPPLPRDFQWRRVLQQQSKDTDQIKDSSSSSPAEPLAFLPGSEGNDTKLFSGGGVDPQRAMPMETFGRSESACLVPAQDRMSCGSKHMDPRTSGQPPPPPNRYQVPIRDPRRQQPEMSLLEAAGFRTTSSKRRT